MQRPITRKRRTRAQSKGSVLWMFDLDNTLHDASYKIFPKINVGMTAAVMETLGVDETLANQLRTRYWKRYGATMIGMVKHHQVCPHRFLRRSHDFDVRPLIRAESGLANKLARLPGRKILVTNAPSHYAQAVMKHLGILRCFDAIWAIEDMRLMGHFHPKPSVKLMRHILGCEGVKAQRAILVEDTLENLRGARAAGLRTVHIFHPNTPFASGNRGRPDYVDLRIKRIGDLLTQKRPVRHRSVDG